MPSTLTLLSCFRLFPIQVASSSSSQAIHQGEKINSVNSYLLMQSTEKVLSRKNTHSLKNFINLKHSLAICLTPVLLHYSLTVFADSQKLSVMGFRVLRWPKIFNNWGYVEASGRLVKMFIVVLKLRSVSWDVLNVKCTKYSCKFYWQDARKKKEKKSAIQLLSCFGDKLNSSETRCTDIYRHL